MISGISHGQMLYDYIYYVVFGYSVNLFSCLIVKSVQLHAVSYSSLSLILRMLTAHKIVVALRVTAYSTQSSIHFLCTVIYRHYTVCPLCRCGTLCHTLTDCRWDLRFS